MEFGCLSRRVTNIHITHKRGGIIKYLRCSLDEYTKPDAIDSSPGANILKRILRGVSEVYVLSKQRHS